MPASQLLMMSRPLNRPGSIMAGLGAWRMQLAKLHITAIQGNHDALSGLADACMQLAKLSMVQFEDSHDFGSHALGIT